MKKDKEPLPIPSDPKDDPPPQSRMLDLEAVRTVGQDFVKFCAASQRFRLRNYQKKVGQTIIDSIINQKGLSFTVMFPRQSGKNELQAQLEAFLLASHADVGGEMVKISPTWKPQTNNAMHRLEKVLKSNLLCKKLGWQREQGYIYRMGEARLTFLSGSPEANIVGTTASLLLEVDEAQEILVDKFDREIAPMAASTNATRVFWGTAWTSQTLLGRELRAARQAQAEDGQPRAFVLTAEDVMAEVPAYRKHVNEQVRRLGRSHPLVRTQYFSEEVDGECGMFPPERRSLMQGEHAALYSPQAGQVYALAVDIAGEDRGTKAGEAPANPGRDSTALTIFEVDLSTQADPGLRAPTYRVVSRRLWTGAGQVKLYGEIRALAERWQAVRVVVDATGVGAGLAAFLERSLPGRVIPFTFNRASKSQLGWDFINLVDAGRYREHRPAGDALQERFWREAAACQMEARPGPGQAIHWGVPDGTRSPVSGELLHDDLLISAALCAVLDRQPWASSGPALVVRGRDPLEEMEGY